MSPIFLLLSAAGLFTMLGLIMAVTDRRSSSTPAVKVPKKATTKSKRSLFDRMFRPLTRNLSVTLDQRISPKRLALASNRLSRAGNPGGLQPNEWLAVRYLIAVTSGVISGLIFALFGDILAAIMIGFVIGLISYVGSNMWLSRRITSRRQAIVEMLPDMLDLLVIAVRAGLGFDAALERVISKFEGPLSDEFRRAQSEIRIGQSYDVAWRAIIERTDIKPLTNFVNSIIQAKKLGVSFSQVLAVQSEQLRDIRKQRAEELAAQAPIKMLFPLVGCIFPSMLTVLLSPAAIKIMMILGSTNL